MRRALTRLAAARRGVVLIEFAFVLPVLVLLFLGGFNIARAMAFSRKATTAAHAIADLSAQPTTITKDMLASIIAIKDPLTAPFPLDESVSRVSEVTTDGSGAAKVDWSYAVAGTAYAKGNAYALPSDFQIPNLTYIVTDLEYAYRPFGGFLPGQTIPLAEHVILLPRQSRQVQCTDC